MADEDEGNDITDDSNMADPNRRIWVVTTAALPWFTGTAVNPLLRALYLTRGRPKYHVTLMIPWMDDETSRRKLYGTGRAFRSQGEQETWIRNFCRERAGAVREEENLRFRFYPSVYVEGFGSIFPTVDLCSLIPREEADIAILEEPEHLNWVRVPAETRDSVANSPDDDDDHDHDDDMEGRREGKTKAEIGVSAIRHEKQQQKNLRNDERERSELGWARLFRHVVGILHTNYAAYMSQYGVGTSFIAAPAIGLLSSIVVRSYCHRVIRLSDVLPSLAHGKEVTRNVHGVRSEFMEHPPPPPPPPPPAAAGKRPSGTDDDDDDDPSRVYFIGKIIWAKGFDKLLELQDMFRRKHGDYFPIDVYGSGSDETSITRAFLGRKHDHIIGEDDEHRARRDDEPESVVLSESDKKAAGVFDQLRSLREFTVSHTGGCAKNDDDDTLPSAEHWTDYHHSAREEGGEGHDHDAHAISILGDLSSKSVHLASATSKAVYHLGDSIVKAGLQLTFTAHYDDHEGRPTNDHHEEDDDDDDDKSGTRPPGYSQRSKKPSYFFDPPRSTYELRKHPIPARFLGRVDHVKIRDIPRHKIFLNMSTTEVLCTTTAEALAMSKFVILPKHPSNAFFVQFPNCLSYESLDDCVERLDFAMKNDPPLLSEELLHKFTWGGATERLFDAAKITKREMAEREKSGITKADMQVARFHIESTRKGHFLTSVFNKVLSQTPLVAHKEEEKLPSTTTTNVK